ncbi:hypothetical protein D1BOALGB6SA_1446 [Olavius sp. associated proteobacterium Delta 1]|nr:hypothetical protein D1BOALGB6SA_1446 [Olavius sp. associated proteobacterium Delta 1]
MILNLENRDKTRFEHESAVTLENKKIGLQRSARMYNYSDCGLYIEADQRLEPETEIIIGIPNSPFASEPDKFESYRGVVKWRNHSELSAYYYGYGFKIIKKNTSGDSDEDPYVGSREHPRKDCAIAVRYESDNQIYEGATENVSSGGVFIKTLDPVTVGRVVRIDIPIKKKGKIKRLTGKVTWSTRNGFGVRFVRSE